MAGPAPDYLFGIVEYLSGEAIEIVIFLELGFVGLWLTWGSAERRRSHFWARLALASLGVPALVASLVGVARLDVLSDAVARALLPCLFVAGVAGLMLVPGLLYRRPGSSPGPSESDGGGGSGPGRPRPSPSGPRGGVPLPDAEQARVRARDHWGPRFDEPRRRRPAHKPRRTPARPTR